MATVISQHVRHIGRQYLGFFKNYILHKMAANFTEISRKHVFAASNRNLIYAFNYAQIVSDDIIQLTSKDALIIRLQVLKVPPPPWTFEG